MNTSEVIWLNSYLKPLVHIYVFFFTLTLWDDYSATYELQIGYFVEFATFIQFGLISAPFFVISVKITQLESNRSNRYFHLHWSQLLLIHVQRFLACLPSGAFAFWRVCLLIAAEIAIDRYLLHTWLIGRDRHIPKLSPAQPNELNCLAIDQSRHCSVHVQL